MVLVLVLDGENDPIICRRFKWLVVLTYEEVEDVIEVLGRLNADVNKNLLLHPPFDDGVNVVVLDIARRHVVRRPIIELLALLIVTIDVRFLFSV